MASQKALGFLPAMLLCALGVASLTHCVSAPIPPNTTEPASEVAQEATPVATEIVPEATPAEEIPVAEVSATPLASPPVAELPVATATAAPLPPSPSQITFENRTPARSGEGPVVETGLEVRDVQSAFGKEFGRIRSCYEKGLREFPAVQGRLTLDFHVDTKGRAASVRVLGSDVESKTTEKCLMEMVKGMNFPVPRGRRSVHVQYPLALEWASNYAEVQKRMQGCWEGTFSNDGLPFTHVSLAFEKGTAKPRAVVGKGEKSEPVKGKNGKKGGAKKAPRKMDRELVLAFGADVNAASLRADRFAMILGVSDRKVGIAGTVRPGASAFVGVVQVDGRRGSMTFEKKECKASLVKKAGWLADAGNR